MKIFLRLGLLFGLFIASSFEARASDPTKPLITAVSVEKGPVIDGSLDDAAWSQAPETAGFTQISVEHGAAKHPTFVRCLYDGSNLYFAFRCVQPKASIQTLAGNEGMVWTDDCVELFLTPHISTTLLQTRPVSEQYFHLIFNAAGTKFDELGAGGASSWDGAWEVKTQILDDQWQAEVKVPFATLYDADVTPPPFTSWNVQICRSSVQDAENTTLFPSLGVYRNPVGFGYLVFVPQAQGGASVRWNIDRQNTMLPRLAVMEAALKAMAPFLKSKFGPQIDTQNQGVAALKTAFEATPPQHYDDAVKAAFLQHLAAREKEVRALQEQVVSHFAASHRSAVILAPHPAVKDDDLVNPDFLPAQSDVGRPVKVTVTPEQYQAASFIVWTKQALPDLFVDVSALEPIGTSNRKVKSLAAQTVDVRWVKSWYQAGNNDIIHEKNTLTPELLLKNPQMVTVDYKAQKNITLMTPETTELGYPGDAATLQPITNIRAHMATQVWLTVQVPSGTRPGRYRGAVNVRSNGKWLNSLPLEVHVLDFDLAPSMLEHNWFAKTAWGSSQWGQNPGRALAEVQDMARHGVTNVGLLERIDELPKAIAIMRKGGLNPRHLYITRQINPAKAEEEAGNWLKTARGAGIDSISLYLEDEAKGERLRAERPSAEAIHRAGVQTWVAGYADFFPIAGDVIDAVVMSGGMVNQKLVSQIHGMGHKIFSYGNPQGGVERPERYRRNYGLLLWQNNYDGAFDWAYYWSFGTGNKNWCSWDDFQHPYWRQHCMVYPTRTGVVDSIQWEGWREGVTDCRYLATLQGEISMARKEKRNLAAVEKAEAWIAALKAGGVPALADLDGVRAAMIAHIQACRAARR